MHTQAKRRAACELEESLHGIIGYAYIYRREAMNNKPSCPNCGTYEVVPTGDGKPDEFGQCEYRCDECGEYFAADAYDEDEDE